MDFDLTQVVTNSDMEDENEENDKSDPVAHIKVINQPSLKSKLFPIHKGDNTVGRQDLCQVSIPVRSLSKKHACIEVRGRSHFIYDMGSRNRTRRGTHYLTPEVRYELRNNDMVVFADVSCVYMVEDSARASDSGSETDPMSDSETVFHTVAVDMYNSVEATVNRVIEPELEIAVASDPNSCDSAASSDILMPTQDFAVSKSKQESQIQTEAVQGSESPVIKNTSKEEAIKFLVIDSDSENEPENLVTNDMLSFQNNGNHEDSLDLDLLAAATQAYVADSEDDDNKSEILDLVHDYKTTDHQSALFVADTQSDDSPKPSSGAQSVKKERANILASSAHSQMIPFSTTRVTQPPSTNSEEPTDKIDRNGSASPTFSFRTSFAIDSPRTYSRKGARNKKDPEIVPSKSIDAAKKEGEKPVEEDDFEETQDPNLFAMSTLVADENILRCPPSPDSKSPLLKLNSDKNATLNTTNDETETVLVTADDTLTVSYEIATLPVNNEETATVPVTNDVITSDNIANTQVTTNQAATVLVLDTIPVTSHNGIPVSATKDDLATLPVAKDDDNTTPILNDETATLVVSGEDLATVEVMTDETMVVAMDIDVRGTETVEVDQLQEESSKQKQSKKNNSGVGSLLKPAEESNNIEAKSHLETYETSTPSKEPSSPSQLTFVLSGGENTTESKKKLLPETEAIIETNFKLITPVKGKKGRPLNAGLKSDYNSGIFDVHVLNTPSAKGKSPKIPMRQSDEEVLEATQPYMIDGLDSPPVPKDSVKAKRSLPFGVDNTEGSDGDSEDETQPYVLEDNKKSKRNRKAVGSHSPAHLKRDGDHDISDEAEDSMEVSQKERCLKNVTSYREAETLPLLAEGESDTDKIESKSKGSQTDRSTAGKCRGKKVPAIKGTKEETSTETETPSSKAERAIQDVKNGGEPTKMEESLSQNKEKFANAPKESSNLATARITETSEPSEVVHSEEASVAQMLLGEKRTTRRSSKDSEESGEIAVQKPGRRGRKRKTAEEKESAGQSSKTDSSVGAEEKADKEEDIGSKTRKARRSVHFVGISSSEENTQEATETRSSRSRRSLKESQEPDEAVGRRTRGRPSTKQAKGKKGAISEKIHVADTKESSTKGRRSRGRKSKTEDDDDNQKDSRTTGNTENDKTEKTPVIVNQRQSKRTSTVLDECTEMNSKDSTEDNSTKGKKTRGRKPKANNNDNQKEDESETLGNAGTDGVEEMTVAKESSEEMPILGNEVLKEEKLEILEKSSEVTSSPTPQFSTLEESVPEEGEDGTKDDASKLTTNKAEGKAGKNSEKGELTLKTEDKVEKDSQKDRTSITTGSPQNSKDVDEKEENINNDTKTKVTEVPSNERVTRTSKSEAGSNTTVFEDSEKVPENDFNNEPTPRRTRGRPRKAEKTNSEVTSSPTPQSSTLEEAVPEEGEDGTKDGASKLTTMKAEGKNSEKELTLKTENKVEKDSQKDRTSRTTSSPKSKDADEKEENINNDTKTKVTEVPSNEIVTRTSKSEAGSNTTVFEDSEKVPENDFTTEPIPKRKRGRPRKDSEIVPEEPPVSNRASRSTRKTSLEEKVPDDTCATSRLSRSERTKKGKDQDGEGDAEKVTAKDRASQRQTKKDSEESADKNKVVGTRGRKKSKISKNSHKDNEASMVDNDEKGHDDNDFVSPVSRGQGSKRKAVSQERVSSPSPQRNGNVSSDSFQDSESAKQEPKTPTRRKRNQSSQSSSQSSSFSTPKRQQLNSSLSPGTPSSRSSSSGSKPKIMFTGVADDKFQKIVTDLGGSVVMSFDRCTHLVTDKIRRTVKFLCCLARGIPIVSPSWLTNCKTAKMFIDHTSHLVSDPSTEKQYKFTLKNSLQQARNGPLLENYKIHVTKSVKPNVDQMKEIMGSCKAQYLRRMPCEEEENTIVISCEEDRTLCQPALDAGIPIVNAEFILTGILQYDISVSKYQIFDSPSRNKRKPSETDKGNATAKKRRR